jgi:formamidopyrimidine-DNA glycosylase
MAFFLRDGRRICYDDSRRFGIMHLTTTGNLKEVSHLKKLGPEPFNVTNIDTIYEKISRFHRPIKELLLDQTILAGLGNIYADEVLYRCRLHPELPGNFLTRNQVSQIIEESKKVLTMAIKAGGTTIRTYHSSQGIDGMFQSELLAYSKEGKPCSRCETPFIKIQVKGRGSTFCPKCQKNLIFPIIVGVTGPMGSGKSVLMDEAVNKGYQTIKSDEVVSDLYQLPNVIEMVDHLLKGNCIIEGRLNKTVIKDKIIRDPAAKKRLEKYIHPLVRLEIQNKIKESKNNFIFVEVPLLFESGFESMCDFTIAIIISENKQLENLKKRNPEHYLEYLSLSKTITRVDISKRVDFQITNNGTINQFIEKINKIFYEIKLAVNKD